LQRPAITDEIDQYIVPPVLGGRAGVMGALALAEMAVEKHKAHSGAAA
jgi:fructokinase